MNIFGLHAILVEHGQKMYISKNETCCDGEIVESMPSFGSSCCGKKSYDYNTHVCYKDEVREKVGDQTYCANELHEYNSDEICCGDAVYNSLEYACCEDVAQKKTESSGPYPSCCGEEIFNDTTHLCCWNVQPGQKPYTLPLESQVFAYALSCCGDQIYDSSNETCCEGKLYSVSGGICCGQNIIDPNTHVCCKDGTSLPIQSPTQGCCAGAVYDRSTTLCCADTEMADPKFGEECCGKQVYNIYKQECCYGTVFDRSPAGVYCCASQKVMDDYYKL